MDTPKQAAAREFAIRPIGFIRSPIKARAEAPCQGSEGSVVGELVVDEAYREALQGLEPGRRIVILYWMHQAERDVLQVHPRRDYSKPVRGVFATRSPDRPNPIALDTVEILEIDGNVLKVRGLDAIDNTPLIDIKSKG